MTGNEMNCNNQYFLCPPPPSPPPCYLAAAAALILLWIEFTKCYCPHWMLFYSTTKAFFNCARVHGWEILTLPYPSTQIVPQMLYDYMVASRAGRCYFVPENPDKLWLNMVGHCPAVKSADVAAGEGLQWGGGSHPCTLPLSYCPL